MEFRKREANETRVDYIDYIMNCLEKETPFEFDDLENKDETLKSYKKNLYNQALEIYLQMEKEEPVEVVEISESDFTFDKTSILDRFRSKLLSFSRKISKVEDDSCEDIDGLLEDERIDSIELDKQQIRHEVESLEEVKEDKVSEEDFSMVKTSIPSKLCSKLSSFSKKRDSLSDEIDTLLERSESVSLETDMEMVESTEIATCEAMKKVEDELRKGILEILNEQEKKSYVETATLEVIKEVEKEMQEEEQEAVEIPETEETFHQLIEFQNFLISIQVVPGVNEAIEVYNESLTDPEEHIDIQDLDSQLDGLSFQEQFLKLQKIGTTVWQVPGVEDAVNAYNERLHTMASQEDSDIFHDKQLIKDI